MTFPEALRTLAQLRPEKFRIKSALTLELDSFEIHKGGRTIHGWFLTSLTLFTQDVLDTILLVLDRRVLLRESVTVTEGKRGVRLVATIFDLDWKRIVTVETDETEKNPAMRKALVAVVEELAKEGESDAIHRNS